MVDRVRRRFEKMIAASIPPGVEVLTPGSRDAWLGQRGGTIGASEAAALLGASPFETFYTLWCRKSGLLPGTEESGPMRRGRLLEAVAVEFLREEQPDWIVIENPMPGGRHYRNPVTRMSCTPDAFVWDPLRPGWGVAQIKSVEPTVYRQQWFDEDGMAEPPLHVGVQVVQELALTGATWAIACPLVVASEVTMDPIEVEPHQGLAAKLRNEADAFWRSVAAGVAPEPDFRADGATIAALHPDDNGQEIDLTGSNELPDLAAELDAIRARTRGDTARADEIRARFRYAIGPNEAAILADGRRVTLRTVRKAGGFVEPTTFRQLRFGRARS